MPFNIDSSIVETDIDSSFLGLVGRENTLVSETVSLSFAQDLYVGTNHCRHRACCRFVAAALGSFVRDLKHSTMLSPGPRFDRFFSNCFSSSLENFLRMFSVLAFDGQGQHSHLTPCSGVSAYGLLLLPLLHAFFPCFVFGIVRGTLPCAAAHPHHGDNFRSQGNHECIRASQRPFR